MRSTLLLSLVLISTVVTAAEEKPKPWYQVEFILFKQPHSVVETSEQWDDLSNKKAPINYEKSIKLSYPLSYGDIEDKPSVNNLEADTNVDPSFKQPDSIVNENLNITEQQEPAVEPDTPPIELQPFTFAPVTDWSLEEVFNSLSNSEQYEILIHSAWIQPGLSRDEAVPVHIHDLMADVYVDESTEIVDAEKEGDLPILTISDEEETVPLDPSNAAVTEDLLEPGFFDQSYDNGVDGTVTQKEPTPVQTTFNGTLTVYLSRYLHVNLNLDYAPQGFPIEISKNITEFSDDKDLNYDISKSPLSSLIDVESPASSLFETTTLDKLAKSSKEVQKTVYRMQESRRMRSRRLHYLDHPKIGVLIQIIPVEMPQKDIEESSRGS
ncbi:MAG: hypothetical protein GQ470_00110 [Gammaproteobacteria bacterium]|nr:hypothetical protein [Gammaproteobacteria bacterium]